MSKEMKDRLRKEYVGFGGAENQVRVCVDGGGGRRSSGEAGHWRRWQLD
jgi:hypothetical protein